MINLKQISFNLLKIFLFIITLFFYCQTLLSAENKIIFKRLWRSENEKILGTYEIVNELTNIAQS